MKTKLRRTAYNLFILLCFVSFNSVGADDKFEKLSSPNGRTFGFVTAITQDKIGEMWFSTKLGLVRYNGRNFTYYVHEPLNSNSLNSNILETVYADNNGDIWVGSLGGGLTKLDPSTGIFTRFNHDPQDPNSLPQDTVTSVLQDHKGIFWIGTHNGLCRYNPEENNFITYKFEPNKLNSLSSNQVRRLYEDSEGNLWIGTGSPYVADGGGAEIGGLNRFNRETNDFKRFVHDPENENSLLNNKVSAIYEDNKGVLWIGTGSNGIHKLDKTTGTITREIYDSNNPGIFGSPAPTDAEIHFHITFITQDITGNYWLGTTQHGIFRFDEEKKEMVKFSDNNNIDAQFIETGAWSVSNSIDGILWIGSTSTGNIYKFNPQKRTIPYTKTGQVVFGFLEESDGTLWIASDNNLIIKNNPDGSQQEFGFDVVRNINRPNNIQSIIKDSNGDIWAGGGQGLFIFDKNKQKFVSYKSLTQNNLDEVLDIYDADENTLWVASISGFHFIDKKNLKSKTYFVNKQDTVNIGKNVITAILKDKKNNNWIGSWNGNGINKFDRNTYSFKNYLPGASIVQFLEDQRGEIWAGILDGLAKYDPQIDDFVRFSKPELTAGLIDISGIFEDDLEYLWITTGSGIIRINPERDESVKIDENYGIENSQYAWKAIYKNKNGILYFGADSGYYKINPVELLDDRREPIVSISNFRLEDKTIVPEEKGILKDEISKTKEIRLQHDQNIFSIDFNIIDYISPEDNQTIYFLENYNNNWIRAGSEQRAYYFNVPPGNYTFRVKGANSYGVWAEKSLDIIIMPPWYRTSWAYGFYVLILAALVFAFDRVQRRRILLLERKKAQKRELQHAREIEKAYKELKATQKQLIQSEKMASLGELTAGIAHEIQNPLNFVNNFSELNKELLGELKEEIGNGNQKEVIALANDLIKNEEKIIHHGKRAESIVKGMLLHSRGSSGVKEPTDINALADEYLRLAYHGLRAKDKTFNATMKTSFDESLGKINIVPQDVGRVILNLVTNAFYAVTEKRKQHIPDYMPEVSVTTSKEGKNVLITVSDNGGGVPASVADKIFQPFFTTKPSGQGTGLGLSMSYEIITKAHNGELKLKNNEGVGATFTIVLPV